MRTASFVSSAPGCNSEGEALEQRRKSACLHSTFSPQINRLVHLSRRVMPVDALARAGRFVSGVDDFQHFAAILAGFNRRLLALHAAREVLDLLRETVVPDFLEHGEGVAFRRGGFFDGVAVAGFTVCQERTAAQQVGARETAGAVNLTAIIDAALLGPAVFRQTNLAAFVFDQA